MSFQPFVPTGGLAGWRFLQNTSESQRKAHGQGAVIERDLAYFRENIAKIDTAEQLVGNYRLLSVALEAFGLGDDVGSKFLIRRVLEGGTSSPDALANKLSDKRYRDLSRAFGFGDFPTPSSKIADFSERIEARYRDQKFEKDMGRSSETMRLALNAQRELPVLAGSTASNRTKWFTLMGTPPLRKVMETALGLPRSFATLPIDRQLTIFMERTQLMFGTNQISEFGRSDKVDKVLDRYAVLDGISGSGSAASVTSPALFILRGF